MSAPAAAPRKGDWIQTFSGKRFWPLDPRASDACLLDVAHHLSQRNRYGGATRVPYSVAQHAVLLSRAVPERLAYAALHHDDAEAYLPDIPSPVKPHIPGFKEIEHAVEMAVIVEHFGVSAELLAEVKPYDARIVADERVALLLPCEAAWQFNPEPLGIDVTPWPQAEAARAFIARHHELLALAEVRKLEKAVWRQAAA